MNFRAFLFGTEGDMVERGLILAAIVVAAVAIWFSLGARLADKLRQVEASIW
jgi:Flp pilus assembly pilin Flp